jgi:hypothetical protein
LRGQAGYFTISSFDNDCSEELRMGDVGLAMVRSSNIMMPAPSDDGGIPEFPSRPSRAWPPGRLLFRVARLLRRLADEVRVQRLAK